ncbi:MAG: MBL fold metallo-hydrolase [Pyramidobacter sp.]|nr:MBL fold metallo-hydrolase [Pyramidobacter sp.]
MSRTIRALSSPNGESLTLIPLPMAHPGFEGFLGSWLLQSEKETVLVDCGVGGTFDALKSALDELNAVPDLLLLTHIHLDHAGAAGHLCRSYPGMKVFCFEKAAKHLISPEKLWQATAATLGEAMAQAYQPPVPVPQSAVITREELSGAWTVIDTPGHAPHHVSFIRDSAGKRICFGGEALGVIAGEGSEDWFADGIRRPGIRPATPPRYVPSVGRASMKRLEAEPWDLYCAGHFGTTNDRTLPRRAAAQIDLWEEKVAIAMECGMSEKEIVTFMTQADPELAGLAHYTPDNRERELYFLGNSVRGFMQYFKEKDGK